MKFGQKKVSCCARTRTGRHGSDCRIPADAQDIVRYVTGSNLPRTEVEGALPVQTITAEEIARTGTITVQDLVLLISANHQLGVAGRRRRPWSRSAWAELGVAARPRRPAHARAAERQAPATYAGGIKAVEGVNLTAIPTSAIERVEVLTDGASAIYGTDAIAGVINFILRQDFTGVEATAYYGVPTRSGGGDQVQLRRHPRAGAISPRTGGTSLRRPLTIQNRTSC